MSKKKKVVGGSVLALIVLGAALLSKCSGFGLGIGVGNGDASSDDGNGVLETEENVSIKTTDSIIINVNVDTKVVKAKEEIRIKGNDYIYKNNTIELIELIDTISEIDDCEVIIIQDKASYDAVEELKSSLNDKQILFTIE